MHAFNNSMKILPNSSKVQTSQNKGFTLLELVVASAVALSVLGIALGLLTEQRRLVLGDRTRATANDNLRLASDLIGQDIKQAGERLDTDILLPGISIIAGVSGAPSTLSMQRQLLTEKLPVCQPITAGTITTSIDISVQTGPTVSNCLYSYSAPTGGEPSGSPLVALKPTQNLRSLRNYRCTLDAPATSPTTDSCSRTSYVSSACQQLGGTDQECGWAYISQVNSIDPTRSQGEFFLYSFEDTGTCAVTTFPAPTSRTCQRIRRADNQAWQNSYTYSPSGNPANQPQIYILEERRYSLTPDTDTARTDDFIMQLSVNRQTPKRIANQISNFQVWGKVPNAYNSAPFNAPSIWGCNSGVNPGLPSQWYCTSFNPDPSSTQVNLSQRTKDWQDLQGVRVALTGINPNDQLLKVDTSRNILSLTSEFFPRNVSSQ